MADASRAPTGRAAGRPIIAVHGGAGAHFTDADDPVARGGVAALRMALARASAILEDGGDALDAVVAAVSVLEDAEELNAGRGAALTAAGTAECDAAVAEGRRRGVGAVALTTRVRHPIALARRVLEEGRHVLVAGPAADALAGEFGLELVSPEYFVTERRTAALQAPAGAAAEAQGTVGAVALDAAGHLAAATSTGGMSGQRPGRIGDSPIAGAGTFADDATCAVSATGDGEAFLRACFAHDVHARIRYMGASLGGACDAALAEVLRLGGRGGCIAVHRSGHVVMPFTTAAMFRGWAVPGAEPVAGVLAEDLVAAPAP